MGVTSKEQIPIVEKALKLVSYFSREENEVINQKEPYQKTIHQVDI